MPLSSDELAMRAALDDLTAGQPDAPVERLSTIRGRHVRRRRAQGIAACVATAAVVVGTLFGAGAIGRTGAVEPAQHRHLPAWALQWPDHRDPTIPANVTANALIAWRSRDGGAGTIGTQNDPFYAPRRVIWYDAIFAAGRSHVVVAFEVERADGDHRLVVGYATADEVMHGQEAVSKDGVSPWILYDVAAPRPTSGVVLGLNLSVGYNNVVVVLTSPAARSALWQVIGADRRSRSGTIRLSSGYGESNTLQIRSRVTLASVEDKSGQVLARNVLVGVSGAPDSFVPQLAKVPDFVAAGAGYVIGPITGQGSTYDVDETTPQRGLTTIIARCYGGSSIRVALDADTAKQTVTIPCDDKQHAVPGPAWLRATEMDVGSPGVYGHSIHVIAGKVVAYRVAVTSRGG